jgi:hypothetical protein
VQELAELLRRVLRLQDPFLNKEISQIKQNVPSQELIAQRANLVDSEGISAWPEAKSGSLSTWKILFGSRLDLHSLEAFNYLSSSE